MEFMKWLRWIGSSQHTPLPTRKPAEAPAPNQPSQTGDAVPQTAPEAVEIDLDARRIMRDAVSCAKHALVMEFRDKHQFDPTPEDLADWAKPMWPNRDQVQSIIRRHNPMALSLGAKFPEFWPELEKSTLTAANQE